MTRFDGPDTQEEAMSTPSATRSETATWDRVNDILDDHAEDFRDNAKAWDALRRDLIVAEREAQHDPE